ncbi:MAG: DUF6273 domain-containing protein [Defluviitaleaceae bacterium]|nr:DUF6273 domain-containing protein [Defluviitaleaceae bacterium]
MECNNDTAQGVLTHIANEYGVDVLLGTKVHIYFSDLSRNQLIDEKKLIKMLSDEGALACLKAEIGQSKTEQTLAIRRAVARLRFAKAEGEDMLYQFAEALGWGLSEHELPQSTPEPVPTPTKKPIKKIMACFGIVAMIVTVVYLGVIYVNRKGYQNPNDYTAEVQSQAPLHDVYMSDETIYEAEYYVDDKFATNEVEVITSIPDAQVGNLIEFGGIEWRVLDVQSGRALLLSDKILEHRAYHRTNSNITWEASDIRAYLNNDFYNSFSTVDRGRIRETRVVSNANPWWETRGGSNTTDRIFLLSIDEVLKYFGDSGMVASGTTMSERERSNTPPSWPAHGIYRWGIHDEYSEARIAHNTAGEASWWWLRSLGLSRRNASDVGYVGNISVIGDDAGRSGGGVRPALWLNL